ncbi:helix-turn-helix domain-containing protein [Mycobacterium sp. OTB74]|uniref:PucR family transcriptional regulator n=1 Tax=Mycobacterium sp. OTB74 TaxID=1853452 RepID=UPI002475EB2C|nr:helix-turn-helix domain-containing protein [Mycobacterium sp. OTB74]MDH6243792.1 DNA-binding PucR family transcriptional regulator [Mycobacterium sp. OTB74]
MERRAQVAATNAESAALIVARLGERLDGVSEAVLQHLLTEIDELAEEVALLGVLRESVQQNVHTVFSAIQHEIPVVELEAPPAALEHARELARRGAPVDTLIRAYRLGHQALLEIVLDEVRQLELPAEQSLDVFQLIATITFKYIDQISHQVTVTYQVVRDQCLAAANTARGLRVRELLNQESSDIDAMSAEIGYPLRRVHLAVVFSYHEIPRGQELVHLERFARALAEALDSPGAPLLIADDRLTGWAWIPLPTKGIEHAVQQARAFVANQPNPPLLAVGDPLPGMDGFRRSHRQALGARSVALVGGRELQVIANSDPGVAAAALHAANLPAAREWVEEVLGPLGEPTEADERLRDTLRVFLQCASSYKAAATELNMHFNTVRYRVQRAEERLGRPITGADRLDVEIALLLCHWLQGAVLS